MKYLFIALLTVSAAHAHTIKGTPILKGSLKTKVIVNTIEATCRAEVEKVKNLFEEDAFGNPAYTVRVEVKIDGNDTKKKIKVDFAQKFQFTNLHPTTGVSDTNYLSAEGATLQIDEDGRLKNVQVPFQGKKISCLF